MYFFLKLFKKKTLSAQTQISASQGINFHDRKIDDNKRPDSNYR